MANWKWRIIGIKDLLQEESNIENTIRLCELIDYQLKKIKVSEKDFDYEDIFWIELELEDLIDNFEFLRKLLDGSIPEKEWRNFNFSLLDREETFNEYLERLYDFGDTAMQQKNGVVIKLMWVG